ncbi:tyrosine-type recombinase/integrase [Nocardia sp. NPDC059246]|uniref:tyrosine-type recombinase/integrase n=1 Tax=unclassified Nocardia TaxID=2637762 RepID=UPI0036C12B17
MVGAVDAGQRADRFGWWVIPEGLPFILASDGSYHWVLNRFLRALPTLGVRSRRSWRAYARDLVTWERFLLERRGRTLLTADRSDLEAFYAARRLSDPPFQVSATTWNRSDAALEKFYQWALAVELLPIAPFGPVQQRSSGGVSVVRAREKAARHGDVRFLSMPRYTGFREVGLRGCQPSGAEDPNFVNRCGSRNAVFADLCVTTGLRLTEVNSLLACELPVIDVSDGARSARFDLPAPVAKGGRGRVVYLPHRVLRQVRDYTEAERAVAIQRAQARGWSQDRRWLPVRMPDRHGGVVGSGFDADHMVCGPWSAWKWPNATPELRARLMEVDETGRVIGPLALWVSERGTPMSASSWESVFGRASARCRSVGLDIAAGPHTLRHTFAVHLLTQLVRRQIAGMRSGAADLRHNAYRRVMRDPLERLQKLLGHASVTTTFIYLDSVAEAQDFIDDAVAELADRVEDTELEDLLTEAGVILR